MDKLDPHQLITAAQAGDEEAREALLREHRNWVNTLARRSRWYSSGPDGDEFSIAFLALNEAIDTYRPGARSFRSYAYTVINNRLRDYYRKESKHHHLSLEYGEAQHMTDAARQPRKEQVRQAWVDYYEQEAARERARELAEYRRELERCGVDLGRLPEHSPQHEDTRQAIIAAARVLADDSTLREQFLASGRVPLSELEPRVGLSRKTLKRWRRFLVAVALVFAHPEWEQLNLFFYRRRPDERTLHGS